MCQSPLWGEEGDVRARVGTPTGWGGGDGENRLGVVKEGVGQLGENHPRGVDTYLGTCS